MNKRYVYLGIAVLIVGSSLYEVIGDDAYALIWVSLALIAYGVFYSNIQVKAGRLSSPAHESIPPPPPSQEENVYYCKECGNPLTYIEKYKRWYCYSCEEYA